MICYNDFAMRDYTEEGSKIMHSEPTETKINHDKSYPPYSDIVVGSKFSLDCVDYEIVDATETPRTVIKKAVNARGEIVFFNDKSYNGMVKFCIEMDTQRL